MSGPLPTPGSGEPVLSSGGRWITWEPGRRGDGPEAPDTGSHDPGPDEPATPDAPPPSRFSGWRRTRPFWGGLAMAGGGVVVLAFPFTFLPSQYVTAGLALGGFDGRLGVRSLMLPLGYLVALLLVAAGVGSWLRPSLRLPLGLVGVIGGVAAFALGHLGGLVVGSLLAIVGGAMTLAWTDQPRPAEARRDT